MGDRGAQEKGMLAPDRQQISFEVSFLGRGCSRRYCLLGAVFFGLRDFLCAVQEMQISSLDLCLLLELRLVRGMQSFISDTISCIYLKPQLCTCVFSTFLMILSIRKAHLILSWTRSLCAKLSQGYFDVQHGLGQSQKNNTEKQPQLSWGQAIC